MVVDPLTVLLVEDCSVPDIDFVLDALELLTVTGVVIVLDPVGTCVFVLFDVVLKCLAVVFVWTSDVRLSDFAVDVFISLLLEGVSVLEEIVDLLLLLVGFVNVLLLL